MRMWLLWRIVRGILMMMSCRCDEWDWEVYGSWSALARIQARFW